MKRVNERMLNQDFAQISAEIHGRVFIDDLDVADEFCLRPSDAAVREIQRLEEATLTAEQRLGNFRVG
jgi:hypothetical protein